MEWLKTSPLVRSFLGTLLALLLAGIVYRQYQTDQMVRAVVTYLTAAQKAQSAPPKPAAP